MNDENFDDGFDLLKVPDLRRKVNQTSSYYSYIIYSFPNQSLNNMNKSIPKAVSLFFGLLFSFIGFVNLFWGNDPFFGLFILILSLVYYPPVQRLIESKTGFPIPGLAKFAIGAFIIWSSVGVGELFDKIDLMVK
jgi:hypothetical protein